MLNLPVLVLDRRNKGAFEALLLKKALKVWLGLERELRGYRNQIQTRAAAHLNKNISVRNQFV
jgi:hypothetical protein